MRKIIITVPQKKERWAVTFGGGSFRRNNASQVFNYVERKLSKLSHSLGTQLEDKTAVRVNYDSVYRNESLNSKDPKYLLQCLTAFLGDYLSHDLLLSKTKKYT